MQRQPTSVGEIHKVTDVHREVIVNVGGFSGMRLNQVRGMSKGMPLRTRPLALQVRRGDIHPLPWRTGLVWTCKVLLAADRHVG